jgi:branched-subunit amino acid ABC-type transport system permease component
LTLLDVNTDPSFIVTVALNGLSVASLLTLTAFGLSLVFGLGRVVNFGQGAMYALGAFLLLSFMPNVGGFWPSLILVPIVVAAVFIALEVTTIRPIRGRPEVYSLLLTFGIALAFDGIFARGWGTQSHHVDIPDPLTGSVHFLGIKYQVYRLFILVAGFAATGAVWAYIRVTALGRQVRATSDDVDMASAIGIDTRRLLTIVWGLAAGLAAIGGVLAAPLLTVRVIMGTDWLILSFLAVVVGGLGSLRGAVAAAILIGLTQEFSKAYIPYISNEVPDIFPIYLVPLLILLVRPRGLFGEGRVV